MFIVRVKRGMAQNQCVIERSDAGSMSMLLSSTPMVAAEPNVGTASASS